MSFKNRFIMTTNLRDRSGSKFRWASRFFYQFYVYYELFDTTNFAHSFAITEHFSRLSTPWLL